MPFLLGVTGNIGCGKSAVGTIFEKFSIPVIDSDKIAHEIYELDKHVQKQVLEKFGTLDRKEIAKKVFGDGGDAKSLRKELESIVHPAINTYIQNWTQNYAEEDILVNLVPLLFEAQLEARYNSVITVTCDEEIQRKRLRERHPDWSDIDISNRIKSQMNQEEKASRAQYVINNSGSLEDTEKQVKQILEKLKNSK